MIIYKTTCLCNGKIYIGQSRRNQKSYLGSGVSFLLAVEKYGKENFKKEILKSGIKCQKKLDNFERIYIKKFDSTNREVGYNILEGSANKFGSLNPMDIPRVKEKMKESLRKYYKTEEGKKVALKAAKKRTAFLDTEEGEKSEKRRKKKRQKSIKKFHKSVEGKKFAARQSERAKIARVGKKWINNGDDIEPSVFP